MSQIMRIMAKNRWKRSISFERKRALLLAMAYRCKLYPRTSVCLLLEYGGIARHSQTIFKSPRTPSTTIPTAASTACLPTKSLSVSVVASSQPSVQNP